jgi:glycerophosphoryl diester phosphodiesterase
MPAILRALELGAQGVEIDVHATADGVLVVHHDPGLGDGQAIHSLSSSQIAKRELAPGIAIPLLADVLEAVKGRAILFIETKIAGIEFPLLRTIRRSDAEAAVHSFHHDTIKNLKLTMPALRAGVLTSGSSEAAIRAARETGADDVWHTTEDVDQTLVHECHRLGKQVIAWTANSAAECRRIISLDVDGICTDDLSMLSAVAR